MFFLPGMEERVHRYWRMELGGLAGNGGRGHTRSGVIPVERREDGDGLGMGVYRGLITIGGIRKMNDSV